MSKLFLDTNILVYSLDQSNAGKRKKCRELIKSLIGENSGVISTQVMQEFYVAATAKLGADPLLVKDILRSLERFETVVVSPMLIKEAIDGAIINRLSLVSCGRREIVLRQAAGIWKGRKDLPDFRAARAEWDRN